MYRKKKYKRRVRVKSVIVLLSVIIMITAITAKCFKIGKKDNGSLTKGEEISAETKLKNFADKNDLTKSSYPTELIELLKSNPEAEEFVLNYPLLKDVKHSINLKEFKNSKEVPLLLQWDSRWGYEKYGSSIIGVTGCGPVCLSMVCVYLLNDTDLNPSVIAKFSKDNGYCISGEGTSWTLMSSGAEELGLNATELPLDKNRVIKNLKKGNPIICIMGPGDFTTQGHYIVMCGYSDGKIKINDPNSRIRSEKLWDFDDIKSQIRNLWVYTSKG